MIKTLMLISTFLSVFMIRAQETIKYQYNGLDRILIANCVKNATVYYQYDELGNRISKVITTSPTNQPPIAHAGLDQTVNVGATVTLDGSGSFDPEGVAISYLWSAPNGITLSSNTTQKPTFIAPTIAADTQYEFILVVNDGVLSSEPDTVVVFVKTQAIELHISTKEVSNITETSAICGGIISTDGEVNITNRGICWNTTGTPTLLDAHTSDGIGSGSYNSTMTNLIKNTTYFVRAYATNSAGTAYGNEVRFTTTSWAFGEVTNPLTGKTWMDRNLGAKRVAISSTDEEAYGDLYQWGRDSDGHEKRTSGIATTPSDNDNPGHDKFISVPNYDNEYDWRYPQNNNLWQGVSGINNPCPFGFRLPTYFEWDEEIQSWSSNDAEGAFASNLKLPAGGMRDYNGGVYYEGSRGNYWSSSLFGSFARDLIFDNTAAYTNWHRRSLGSCIRCIKDYTTDTENSFTTESIKLYPNPANNVLFIETVDTSNELNFVIHNFMGQVVYKGTFTNNRTIDLTNFVSGVYLVVINKGDVQIQEKLIRE